ncbi:hypothetical protein Lepto7375DRAFT_7272 [Leptolyngbya sp. PCC 7375]|nr:hypothetical protein Lepto7375DRAFT_7272 [Leptolyngbya sp. PCC 7375]
MVSLATKNALIEYFDTPEIGEHCPMYWQWNGLGCIDGQLCLERELNQDIPGKQSKLIATVNFPIDDEKSFIGRYVIYSGRHYINPTQGKTYYRVNRADHNLSGVLLEREAVVA